MMTGRVAGMVMLLLACAALLAPERVAAGEETKRIAVVNVSRVFNAYNKVKDVQEKMEKIFEADRNAIQKDSMDLKKWEDRIRIDTRDPKTNLDFFKEIQGFEARKLEVDLRFRKLYTDVEDKRKTEMRGVLNDIKAAIRAVGTAEKYDLILRAPEFEEEFDPAKAGGDKKEDEVRSAADLVRKFRENPVMYFSQGVDVTDRVIAKLNEDYKNAAPAPGK